MPPSFSRRQFLKFSAGALAAFHFKASRASAAIPGGTLDPGSIQKYVAPLVIPPAMPRSTAPDLGIDYYEIGVRQFQQQILPPGMPSTTVWSYGSLTPNGIFNYPAFNSQPTGAREMGKPTDRRQRQLSSSPAAG